MNLQCFVNLRVKSKQGFLEAVQGTGNADEIPPVDRFDWSDNFDYSILGDAIDHVTETPVEMVRNGEFYILIMNSYDNQFSLEFSEALLAALRKIRADDDSGVDMTGRVLVTISTNTTIFSARVAPIMLDDGPPRTEYELGLLSDIYLELLTLRIPSIAAIKGRCEDI